MASDADLARERAGDRAGQESGTKGAQQPDQDTLHAPAFDLPLSSFLGPDSRQALRRWRAWFGQMEMACPHQASDLVAIREYWNEQSAIPVAERFKSRYAVRIEPRLISGVRTDVVLPAHGFGVNRESRVLLNFHGGGFVYGGLHQGQIESIPIAALSGIRVITIDYRMAPEHRYPAATEDAVAVYRALLEDYSPPHIGIYGCSAGGLLSAQTIARLQREGLPAPAAVGMFFGAAAFWGEGDSAALWPIIAGGAPEAVKQHPYLKDADPDDPLAFPVRSNDLLREFPPSLLVSSARDQALSSVIQTHRGLVMQGVQADLHVWEGLGHAFLYDPDLPQSHEVFEVASRFFNKQLGS